MPIDVDILIKGIEKDIADLDRIGDGLERALSPRSVVQLASQFDQAKAKMAATEQEARALAETFQRMKLSGAAPEELKKVGQELKSVRQEYAAAANEAKSLSAEQQRALAQAKAEQQKLVAEEKRRNAEALRDSRQRMAEQRKADAERQKAYDDARKAQRFREEAERKEKRKAEQEAQNAERDKVSTLDKVRSVYSDVRDVIDIGVTSLADFNQAQAQVISQSAYLAEKGLAIGTAFGATWGIVGAGAGVALAAVNYFIERSTRMSEYLYETERAATQVGVALRNAFALREFKEDLQLTVFGVRDITLGLKDLQAVPVNQINSQLQSLAKAGHFEEARKGILKGQRGSGWSDEMIEAFKANQQAVLDLSERFADDLGQSSARARENVLAQSKAIADASSQQKKSMNELRVNVVGAQRNVVEATELWAQAEQKAAKDIEAARRQFLKTGDIERFTAATNAAQAIIDAASAGASKALREQEKAQSALNRATAEFIEKHGVLGFAFNEISTGAGALGRTLGDLADKAGAPELKNLSGMFGGAGTTVNNLLSDITNIGGKVAGAVEKSIDKTQKAKEAAKELAKSNKEWLSDQRDRYQTELKVLDAYREGGTAAAELERAVQSALQGRKGLSEQQKAEVRAYIEQTMIVQRLIKAESERWKLATDRARQQYDAEKQLVDLGKQQAEQLESQLQNAAISFGRQGENSLIQILLNQGPEAFEKALTSYQKLEAEQQRFFDQSRALAQINPLYRDFFENILVEQGRGAYDRALADFQSFRDQYVQTIQSIADPAMQVFSVLGGAIEQNIAAGYKAFEGLGIAAQKAVGDLLKAKGREYAVKAIGELGEGFALLSVGMPVKAGEAFQASALHAIAAAAAGAGGIGLSGRAGARQRALDDRRSERSRGGSDGGPRLSGIDDATKVQASTVVNLKVYSMTPGSQRDWEEAGKSVVKATQAYHRSGGGR
jgi:hypothetical protein